MDQKVDTACCIASKERKKGRRIKVKVKLSSRQYRAHMRSKRVGGVGPFSTDLNCQLSLSCCATRHVATWAIISGTHV